MHLVVWYGVVWRFWTLACVGSGDHAGRLIQFLFSTELCPWITFGGQVSGHHCRSEGNKAGACVSGGCRTSSASRLEVLDDSAGELELARSRSRRRRPWASKYRDVHSLCVLATTAAVRARQSCSCVSRLPLERMPPADLRLFCVAQWELGFPPIWASRPRASPDARTDRHAPCHAPRGGAHPS